MYGYGYNFVEQMETGKVTAAARRARGLHTGKSAKGWHFKRREYEAGSHDEFGARMKVLWESARADSLEDYRFTVYGDQWEGF